MASSLRSTARVQKQTAARDSDVGQTYRALEKAGLIGCVRGGGVSATKEVVRARVFERFKSRAER
jgi:hypothetical protein